MGFLGTILGFIERLIKLIFRVNEEKLYGLDHAILNIEVPPRSMWMNMGYWRVRAHFMYAINSLTSCQDTRSFPEACEALLEQILVTAGLLNEDKTPVGSIPSNGNEKLQQQNAIKLIDVGIGCGDQSLYLTRKLSTAGTGAQRRPLVESYVGVTFARSQADFARERLLKRTSDSTESWTPDIRIFAADAAKPASWKPRLKTAVLNNHNDSTNQQTWLLALDTLYHFKPSRTPLFNHAYHDLHASLMAFDLLLSDTSSLSNKLLIRLICLVSGIPYSNLLTTKQYADMLVQAGYDREMIEMRDISEYVFSGIANYITEKDRELKGFGMGVGKFKVPRWVFGWWAKTGVIRGVVVVARR